MAESPPPHATGVTHASVWRLVPAMAEAVSLMLSQWRAAAASWRALAVNREMARLSYVWDIGWSA
jgi:hypothetical protein